MTVQAFVEQVGAKRYRVSITQPVALSAEGGSREEAIEHLRQLARERFAAGELLPIDLPAAPQPDPWTEAIGVWKDHPDMAEYEQNIAAYRRQVDDAQSENSAVGPRYSTSTLLPSAAFTSSAPRIAAAAQTTCASPPSCWSGGRC